MKTSHTIFLTSLLLVLINACSDLKNNIPQAPELTVHDEGILDPASPEFHGNLVRNNNWDMKSCQQCHASDYNGGSSASSCLTCHSNQAGPENCSTCHGSSTSPAPPRDLEGNTSTTASGVGAHQVHLGESSIIKTISCTSCHNVPGNVYDQGHLDSDGHADVSFGWLSLTNKGVDSNFDHHEVTCSNTYCHGNWEFNINTSPYPGVGWADTVMKGNNKSVVWNNVDGTQAECGTCHGLPPEGHVDTYTVNECGFCHYDSAEYDIYDQNGNVVEALKFKHINGKRNVFGEEY